MEHYKNLEPDRIQLLERLATELLKDKPLESTIRLDMEKLGLNYSTDSIERINLVLKAIHPKN